MIKVIVNTIIIGELYSDFNAVKEFLKLKRTYCMLI